MSGSARFPWRVFTRVFFVEILLVVVLLAAAGFSARAFFRSQYLSQVEEQLIDTLRAITADLPSTPVQLGEWCRLHAGGTRMRITLINADGAVACDSHHETLSMENHATRPEILEARRVGFGGALRHSGTLDQDMLYGALAVDRTSMVLRAALPLSSLAEGLRHFDKALLLIILSVVFVMAMLAAWAGRSLVFPIGRLLHKTQSMVGPTSGTREVDYEIAKEPFGEWSDLEANIDSIRNDLESKVEQLTREREEQAILMGAISEAILAVDIDEKPLFFNTRFALLADTRALQRGSRLWELFREPEILDAFRIVLKTGSETAVQALPLGPDHTRSYFAVSVSPLKRSGKVYGAVGVFHDVTELKRAEQIRIDFVANVSHELRTPLTAIKGYTDTLVTDAEKGILPEKSFLEVIRRNTERLMTLINDLLDLSSIESSGVIQKSKVETRELSERVIQGLQGQFQERGHGIAIHTDAQWLNADARWVEQVLVNLLDNAAKYTPPGGKIDVAWERAGLTHVLLKVSDTGPGIPAEHHSRLFERFYRVDKGRSRNLGGTGLGLAIVKHIMQRHGGTVWVESQMGRGSTFVCQFPA